MKNIIRLIGILAAICLVATSATVPAGAQASRTWVSGVGDDVNPCSRTAPCKTFAGAISKTAAGGEINCLDPGGWGAVTITKSMTIDCSQFPGSILNSGTPAITVNDSGAGTIIVVIRGLELNAASSVSPGTAGVRFLSGASLQLEDMVIRGNTNSGGGSGVLFTPSTIANLYMRNVVLSQNGGGTGAGVFVQPTGSGTAQLVIENSSFFANATPAFKVDVTGLTGGNGVTFQTDNVQMTGNSVGYFLFAPGGSTTPIKGMIVNNTISGNTNTGILVNGTTATALVSGTTITANGQGVVAASGVAGSYQDNRLFGNTSNNTFATNLTKN